LVSITWKNIFLETSKFSQKHLVGMGIFTTFAGELHNSITNQNLNCSKNEHDDKGNSQVPSGSMMK